MVDPSDFNHAPDILDVVLVGIQRRQFAQPVQLAPGPILHNTFAYLVRGGVEEREWVRGSGESEGGSGGGSGEEGESEDREGVGGRQGVGEREGGASGDGAEEQRFGRRRAGARVGEWRRDFGSGGESGGVKDRVGGGGEGVEDRFNVGPRHKLS